MISAFWAPEGAAGAVKAAMSHDLIVPSVTTSVATAESAGLAKASTGVAVEEPKAVAPSLVGPNPSLELDPMLGLVVIQFRNDAAGTVTDSIPSERQLQAYQRWATTHFGPAPSGMPSIGAHTVAPTQHQHAAATPQSTVQSHFTKVRK